MMDTAYEIAYLLADSESMRKRRTISSDHVVVNFDMDDNHSEIQTRWSPGEGGTKSVSNATTADKEKRLKDSVEKETLEKEFRDKIVEVSRGPVKELHLFMASTDVYPRFICEKVLLSFAQEPAPMETFGSSAVNKFDRFIKLYPDIFQRELSRDGLLLADQPDHERYGVLHAVALIGEADLVYLVRGRNKYSRDVIFKALISTNESDDVSDSFHLLRRALLWRHMMSNSYEKVAASLRKIENARKSTEPEALGKLIDEAAPQIDPSDAYDPWVVVLAWSSVSKEGNPIRIKFEERQKQCFDQMFEKLRKRGSAFTHFLTVGLSEERLSEEPAKITLYDNNEVEVKVTVHGILKILVFQQDAIDYTYVQPQLRRCFLDRFCTRSPNSHWSPLHFAAARGDQDMVSALIDSWNVIIEKLDEEGKKTYTRKLAESFYDAKRMTPLHYGVLSENKEVVKFLVDWKCFAHRIDECDIFMRTAFQMACSRKERARIVQELVTNSRVGLNTKDCCEFSSLHWAVHVEAIETVKHLIFDGKKRAIRALEKDREDQSPYDMAARRKTREHKEIEQLLLNHSAVKDLVERLYRDRQVYVYASNAILISAALIASVTFGGWLEPPAGDARDVLIMWVFNGLSFFFGLATLTSGASAMLPVGDEYIKDAVESIRGSLIRTSILLILSVTCVLGAFAAAGFASLSKIPNRTASVFNNNMPTIITTSVGGFVCGTMLLDFCKRLSRVRPDWLKQALEGNFEVFNVKDIRRMVDSFIIHLRVKVFRLLVDRKGKGEQIFGPHKYIGPENSPVLTSLLKMAEGARNEPLFRSDLYCSPYADRFPPIEVDRKQIQDMLNKIHPQGDIKSCPVRTCYSALETHCLNDILQLKLGLEKDQPLGEYISMWKKLGRQPVRASSSNNLYDSGKVSAESQVADLKSKQLPHYVVPRLSQVPDLKSKQLPHSGQLVLRIGQ